MDAGKKKLERTMLFLSFIALALGQSASVSQYGNYNINVGVSESLFFFGGVAGMLISGRLIDRGYAPELSFCGYLIVGFACFGYGAIDNYFFWGIIKIIEGAGAFAAYLSLLKITVRLYPENAGANIAIASLLFSGGYSFMLAVSPIFTGVIGIRMLLLLTGVLVVAGSRVGLVVMKDRDKQIASKNVRFYLKNKFFFRLTAGYCIGYIIYGTAIVILIEYFKQKGFSDSYSGLLLAISIYPGIVASVIAGKRFETRKPNATLFSFLVFLAVLGMGASASTTILFLCFFVASSSFANTTFVAVSVKLLQEFGDKNFGGAQTLVHSIAIAVGGGLSPLIFNFMFSTYNIEVGIFALAAVIGVCFVGMLRFGGRVVNMI